ncbi:MAG: hypothetical protein NVS3B19_11790 [Ginsengibacter sp.]
MALTQITFDFDDGKQPEKKMNGKSESRIDNITDGQKLKRGRKGLKNIHINADLIEIPNDDQLFSKKYYTIGSVAKMFKVQGSQIRFWENEFDILEPKKNGKGDRLFRPEDIKNLQIIYHLLREKKYTIEGAKEYFKKNKGSANNYNLVFELKKLRSFLLDLKNSL